MGFLRGWSLFYRLVAVSAVAAAAMSIFAFWVTTEHIADRGNGGHWDVAVPLVVAGLAITLGLVFAITRIVLRPIAELEENIVAFGQGDLSARARMPPGASIYPLAERIDHLGRYVAVRSPQVRPQRRQPSGCREPGQGKQILDLHPEVRSQGLQRLGPRGALTVFQAVDDGVIDPGSGS